MVIRSGDDAGRAGGHGRGHDAGKLRGHERAALAHAKDAKEDRGGRPPPGPAPEAPAPPDVIVELSRLRPMAPAEERALTYGPPGPAATVSVHESARIQSNVHIKSVVPGPVGGGGGGTLILEEGASLKINAHIGALVGSPGGGTTVLEKGASVEINAHIGTLIAGPDGGTLRVGENASYKLNLHADVATTGGTVVIPDGVSVKANVHVDDGAVKARIQIDDGDTKVRLRIDEEKPKAPEPLDVDALVLEASRARRKTARQEEAEGDPLRELRDVRWILMQRMVEHADQHRREAARDHRGHGKSHGDHGKGHGRSG